MYSNEAIARIQKDLSIVNGKFSQFRLFKANGLVESNGWKIAENGMYYFTGKLRTRKDNIYTVAVVFPFSFPFGEILSFVVEPYIASTEHRYSDGHLCLYGHEGRGDRQVCGQTSAAAIIAWTAAWLHAYELWADTGKWPMLDI